MFAPVAAFRHRMSDLPSPSKSATPATLHPAAVTVANPDAALTTVAPLMNQIVMLPLAALLHRMSVLPSPSKSPVPTTVEPASASEPTATLLATAAPFICQIPVALDVPLRQRISDLPSPSKSPTPAIAQPRSAFDRALLLAIAVPFISQIASSPVARLRHTMSDLPSPSKSARTILGVFTETAAVVAELFPAASNALTR